MGIINHEQNGQIHNKDMKIYTTDLYKIISL